MFTQGDIGDRYYVIESGEAEVIGDGRVVATLGPGEGFGEIALLRRTRRTATVAAGTPLELRALGSDRFISAVLGYTPSAQAAAAGVDDQLDRYRAEGTAGRAAGALAVLRNLPVEMRSRRCDCEA